MKYIVIDSGCVPPVVVGAFTDGKAANALARRYSVQNATALVAIVEVAKFSTVERTDDSTAEMAGDNHKPR